MKRPALIFALALLTAGQARALDMRGEDLPTVDYETLSGTYTNVGEFSIAFGDTVFAGQGGLYIYAATVTIQGVLNADGRGYAGGANGANVGAGLPGSQGFGPVAGAGGGGGAAQRGGGGGGYGNADGVAPSGGNGEGAGGGAGGAAWASAARI